MEEEALTWLASEKFLHCVEKLSAIAPTLESVGEMEPEDIALLGLSDVEARRFAKCVRKLRDGEWH